MIKHKKFLFVYLIVTILFIVSVNITKATEAWLTGWNFRTPLVLDNVGTSTPAGFQTRIIIQGNDVSKSNFIDFRKVASGGADIRITSSDKTTLIPFFIENWDSTNKIAVLWASTTPVSNAVPEYYGFHASSTLRDNYGLSYPVTYEFDIPAGSSGLQAYVKYIATSTSWTQLTEKTTSDFFNGIDAVRFDYTNNKAYVSVAFDSNSNDIFIKVVNSSGTQVGTYRKITDYYDNRVAGVTSSADDWTNSAETSFASSCDMFASKHLWLAVGIQTVSNKAPNWAGVQSKINAGYIEPASHSVNHLVPPYPDYDLEIGGSRDDIVNNLVFPPLSRKGSTDYLYTWIAPGGNEDTTVYATLGKYKYLTNRDVFSTIEYDKYHTADWDSKYGVYGQIGYTQRMGSDGGLVDATTLNAAFDAAYARGAIYHLMFHPPSTNLATGQYADLHTTYIANRNDVWYVSFGHIYAYKMLKDKAITRLGTYGEKYFMYYGNSNATASSSYDNTFSKDSITSGLVSHYKMDEQTPGTELIQNGSFESWTGTNIDNWTINATSTGVRDVTDETSIVYAGSHAVKLTATSNNATSFGISQNITTVSGEKYQLSVYERFNSRTAGTLYVEAYDLTNSVILATQSLTTATTSGYYMMNVRFTATSTTSVRIRVYLNSETTTGVAYIDSVSVRQSSNLLTDSSANGNTATIYGALRTDTDGGAFGFMDGQLFSSGSALRFDGKDDYVSAGNPASLNNFGTGAISFGAWVYVAGMGNSWGSAIIDKSTGDFSGSNTTQRGFYLSVPWERNVGYQSDIKVAIANGAGYNSIQYTLPASELAGKWHHVFAVADSQSLTYPEIKIYFDGQLRAAIARTLTGSIDATTTALYLGKWNNSSRFFNGYIDDARIYNRALTGDEIRAIFERRKYTNYEPALSVASSTIQSIVKFFKGVTNTVSGDGYIMYPSESSIDNIVSTDLTITPPTGNASTTISDGLISLDYASTTVEGLIVNSIDRQIDIHISSSTSLRIAPSASTLNVEIKNWNKSGNYYKKWVESSPTHSVTTSHTIGDLSPGKTYALKIDGVQSGTYTADNSGQITFTYSDGYSTKTFEVEEVTTTTTDNTNSSSSSSTYGGRLPIGWNNRNFTDDPKVKLSVYAKQVKNNLTKKEERIVKLSFNANKNAKKVELSLSNNFVDSVMLDFQNEIQIDLCKLLVLKSNNNSSCKDGEYTLYARIFNPFGMFSDTISTKLLILPNDKIVILPETSINTKKIIGKTIFAGELSKGLRSNEVTALQKFLSTLSDEIYPEKKITGFYGPLTEKAVQKFQLKYGVVKSENEKGFGVVGPKTRAKLNEIYSK